jgi:hypothetical protein
VVQVPCGGVADAGLAKLPETRAGAIVMLRETERVSLVGLGRIRTGLSQNETLGSRALRRVPLI